MANLQFNSGTTGRGASLSYRFFDADGAWNGAAVTASIAEVGTTGVYVATSVTVPANAVGVYWADSGVPSNNATESLVNNCSSVDLVADAVDSTALAASAGTELADALLNRDMSAVSDTNARSPLNALRFLRNKWSVSGTTLTVTKEDDSTSAWTSTVTTNASADPITGNDPA